MMLPPLFNILSLLSISLTKTARSGIFHWVFKRKQLTKMLSFDNIKAKDMLENLKKIGLTDKEAKVYLANLELGAARIPEIAEKSKIKRTTVYVVIDSLMQKGLVSIYQSKRTKKFVAESPQRLVSILKEKQNFLRKIVPQLEALVKNQKEGRPEVRFYHGREGCLSILSQSLKKPNSEVLYIGSVDELYKIISEEYDDRHYIPTRLNKNIKFKALLFEDKGALKLKKTERDYFREIKFLPKEYFFPCSTLVFQDSIAFISSIHELIGVVIQSADLAQTEKQKFKLLWDKLS